MKYLHILSLLAILSACATQKIADYTDAQQSDQWVTYSMGQAAMRNWETKGRVSIVVDNEHHYASFKWVQTPEVYEITLNGPFNIGGAKIQGSEQTVMLIEQPDAPPLYADTPEDLMAKALGWAAPISALTYWIKGIPVPEEDYEASVDTRGRPRVLRQHGWSIVYTDYEGDFPTRIGLQNQNVKIKIAVQRWDAL